MKIEKLILLQEKSSDKTNIFTISEDSKLIPLFNEDSEDVLYFDKVLPYFDGIELMLNDKYLFKEITQESWDELVKLLDLSQYEKVVDENWFYYKKDYKTYIVQNSTTDQFYLCSKLIVSVFRKKITKNLYIIGKVVKYIIKNIHRYNVSKISELFSS